MRDEQETLRVRKDNGNDNSIPSQLPFRKGLHICYLPNPHNNPKMQSRQTCSSFGPESSSKLLRDKQLQEDRTGSPELFLPHHMDQAGLRLHCSHGVISRG